MPDPVERLRGYDAFRAVFRGGRYYRRSVIVCHYTLEPADTEAPVITVGFASARTRTKVARNRNIRVLRELFRHTHQLLQERCLDRRIRIRMVLLLDKRDPGRGFPFETLKSDIVNLFQTLPLEAQ